MKRAGSSVALLMAVAALSGCSFSGINSKPLPFTKGHGEGSYTVTVVMDNAVNLVTNSEVKVDDVSVGSVRKIEFKNWKAELTIGLDPNVKLPANAEARIGQKSLLGAEYLELAPPAGEPSPEKLAQGDVIGLDRTSRYPETEEVLSGVSSLLNGGGLGQLQTITQELNKAFGGRQSDIRSFVSNLETFVATLDAQKGDIVKAISALDRLSATYAAQQVTVDRALRDLPRGVEALASEREALTGSLQSLGRLGDATHRLVTSTQDDLVANLNHASRFLGGLADAGKDIPEALQGITFPFTLPAVKKFKGDYVSLLLTIDLSAKSLTRDFLGGTPFPELYAGLLGMIPGPTVTSSPDLLKDPLAGLLPKPGKPGGVKTPSAPTSPVPTPGTSSSGSGDLLGGVLGNLFGGGG